MINVNKFFNKSNQFIKSRITENDIKELKNIFSDSESIKETIFRIKYNITVRPTCKYCGGKVKFTGIKSDNYFASCCCKKCSNKYRMYKIRKTKLERYGDPNYRNPEKMKQTNLEKYGAENPFANKEIIDKIQEKRNKKIDIISKKLKDSWNKNKKERIQHIKEGNLKKYGVDNCLKNREIFLKGYNKRKELYGAQYNIKKFQETMIKNMAQKHRQKLILVKNK